MHVFRKHESIKVFQTLSAHWLDLVANLGSYSPKYWWKFEQWPSNFTIFAGYLTNNTAPLGFWEAWRYVGWMESPPPGVGLIWEPIWNRIIWGNGKTESNFNPFSSFLKAMWQVVRRAALKYYQKGQKLLEFLRPFSQVIRYKVVLKSNQ